MHVMKNLQKNPRVRKIFVRNSGAGNGCANFMGAWQKCALSAGKARVHKIPSFRGGARCILGLGGGSADFIFMGARIFLKSDGAPFRCPLFAMSDRKDLKTVVPPNPEGKHQNIRSCHPM